MNAMKKSDYRKLVKKYFGKHLKRLSIIMEGEIACLDIVYMDFHPKHRVYSELSEMMPMSDIVSLERMYSDRVIGDMTYYEDMRKMRMIESRLHLQEL